jgi:hypothetical protein
MQATMKAIPDEATELWVIEQFTLQGFDADQIIELLDARVDHHDTKKMLNEGCPHYLILEIVT